jgi:hypothetical protein
MVHERLAPVVEGPTADETRTPSPQQVYTKWMKGTFGPALRGVDSSQVRDDAVHDLLAYGVPWLRERAV